MTRGTRHREQRPSFEPLEARLALSGKPAGPSIGFGYQLAATRYQVDIIPLNQSGVSGSGSLLDHLQSDGPDLAMLNLSLSGLTPGVAHAITLAPIPAPMPSAAQTDQPRRPSDPGTDVAVSPTTTVLDDSGFPAISAPARGGTSHRRLSSHLFGPLAADGHAALLIHGMIVQGHYDANIPIARLSIQQVAHRMRDRSESAPPAAFARVRGGEVR